MTESRRLDVRIVVVTHNSEDVLEGGLASLPAALEGTNDREIVVVDNASDDRTVALAQATPGVEVVAMGRNAGYAAAINAATAREPRAAFTLVLNPDARLGRGSVTQMIACAASTGAGIVVPELVGEQGARQLSLRRRPTFVTALAEAVLGGRLAARIGVGEVMARAENYARARRVDWATGAVMLITDRCLASVGPWDESFFLYSEETDFCLRAADSGFETWFTPDARCVHIGGESGTSPQLWGILTRNRVRLYAKRHNAVSTFFFRLAVMLNELLRSVGGNELHRAGLAALWSKPDARGEPGSGADDAEPAWICFSAVDWWYFNRAHSEIQLMRRIAEHRRVLFVNSIGMRMPIPGRTTQVSRRILRKLRSLAKWLKRPLPELPGFWVASPVSIPLYSSRRARAANARFVRFQIKMLARATGIDLANAVVMITVPTAWDVVRGLNVKRVIYNRSDRHSSFAEADQQVIHELEQQLLRHSDAVLYVSHALMSDERELTGSHGVFLDHGVDVELFSPDSRQEPEELRAISHPRIGFFGGIDDYTVNVKLLERVARDVPEASLVLVGDRKCPIDTLLALPNVFWLGHQPHERIPDYGAGFDVALMPWLDNEWIHNSNPIKMKEYLALGLPVVSTDFPEVHFYDSVIDIAADDEEFVTKVRSALAGDAPGTPASRRARVTETTWDRQADRLLAIGEDTEAPERGTLARARIDDAERG